MSVEIDVVTFWERLKRLFEHWKENRSNSEIWQNADSILINIGQAEEENPYKKSTTLLLWFLGYEFPETILSFCESGLYILTSPKKAAVLQVIMKEHDGNKPPVPIEILARDGDGKNQFAKLIEIMKKSFDGKTYATLIKEKPNGSFIKSWDQEISKQGLSVVDAAPGFSDLVAVKDQKELKCVRTSGIITTHVLKTHLLPQIETVIDEEKKVTHAELARDTEKLFDDPTKITKKLNPEHVESCYSPLIQSGGKYDLRLGSGSNEDVLHFGTIICSLGARYKFYCTNVARTYLISPDKEQEANYKILFEIHQLIVKMLVPGTKLSKIWIAVEQFIETTKPELKDKFTKNCGFSMGIEFQESAFTINSKNERGIKPGMIFNISVGFNNIEAENQKDPKKKNYSLLLADTVLVKDSGAAEVLTDKCAKRYQEISYFFDQEDTAKVEPAKSESAKASAKSTTTVKPEPKKAAEKPKKSSKEEEEDYESEEESESDENSRNANKRGNPKAAELAALDKKFRESTVQRKEEKNKTKELEDKRKQHQKELEQKKKAEIEARFASSENSKKNVGGIKRSDTISYKSVTEYPREMARGKIYVDTGRESLVIPIFGLMVPFHISNIKNANKTDEEYLRINFITPESIGLGLKNPNTNIAQLFSGSGNNNNAANPLYNSSENSNMIHIKEITYRCPDTRALNNALRLLKELRKRISDQIAERVSNAGIVEQAELVLSKGRNPKLGDIFIRPTPTGRRCTGSLEAHSNGFRFSSHKGEHIDILYANIKHAFFQPAENELIVLVHFHLRHPIKIGKKKCEDVQFCTEVMEMSQALDGRRNDRDDGEDEERERQMRLKLNTDFQNFVRKVEEISNLEFDIPYRELAFTGVPHKAQVQLLPSVRCLVNLTEIPFFVLTLDEIEIAYFERVMFSLKNFDLVFVFKQYDRPVVHINSIGAEHLDTIKEWLDQCNIVYYEGKQNLNWPRIMATIQKDPKKFHTEEGGWSFLNPESGSEVEDEEEMESDFDPGSEGEKSSSEEEESAASGGGEDSEEYSDEESGSAASGSEEEEEEEEVLDWDEMEERALKEDKENAAKRARKGEDYSDDSEEERRKAKRAKPAPKNSAPSKPAASNKPALGKPAPKNSAPSKPAASNGKAVGNAKQTTLGNKGGSVLPPKKRG